MREIVFDRSQVIPEIDAHVQGKTKMSRVRLVFDTGPGITQLDTAVMENMGYSAKDGEKLMRIHSAAGEAIEGYVVRVKRLSLFGIDLKDVAILCYDFDNYPEIDGLLGFDLIKQLHLEMDGPQGVLKVF